MSNFSLSRLERLYLQDQPVFGQIPSTSGSATVSNTNACRFIRLELQNETALLERPDKTGTRSMEGMTSGRRVGRWTIEMSLHANGTAGTAPDCEPILKAIFGQAPAVGAGSTSITSSTDATPIVLTASGVHGVASGAFEVVSVAGHTTNVAANGTFLAYAPSTTTLILVGSVGSGLGAGASGTISRVKRTYTFVDEITYFTLWSFRTASTLDQRVGNTCIVNEVTFNFNQDVATWQASGDCIWALRSKAFATADAYQLGGLTNFPLEPTTPVTNGSIIPGFTGRFTAGRSVASTSASAFASAAATLTTIRNATLRIQTSNMMVKDTFGSYYPTLTEGDVRNVSLSFNIYDDDTVGNNAIKLYGDEKTPVDFIINLGTVIGNTFVFQMRNVYLASHVLGDGQLRFDASYGDSRATTSTLAVRDEFSLTIA